MSQEDIIELLKKEQRPLLSAEIAIKIGKSKQGVVRALCKLIDNGEINKRRICEKNNETQKIVWNMYVYELKNDDSVEC